MTMTETLKKIEKVNRKPLLKNYPFFDDEWFTAEYWKENCERYGLDLLDFGATFTPRCFTNVPYRIIGLNPRGRRNKLIVRRVVNVNSRIYTMNVENYRYYKATNRNQKREEVVTISKTRVKNLKEVRIRIAELYALDEFGGSQLMIHSNVRGSFRELLRRTLPDDVKQEIDSFLISSKKAKAAYDEGMKEDCAAAMAEIGHQLDVLLNIVEDHLALL